MKNKFLSLSGLQTLLMGLNGKFSKKKHSHTISEIGDLKYASKEKAGIISIGEGLKVDENGVLSLDGNSSAISMVIEVDGWIELYNTLKNEIVNAVKNNEVEKFNSYVILKNKNQYVTEDKLHIIQMTPDIVDIISQDKLLTLIKDVQENCKKIFDNKLKDEQSQSAGQEPKDKPATKGKVEEKPVDTGESDIEPIESLPISESTSESDTEYASFDDYLRKEVGERFYPFEYGKDDDTVELLIYYEMIKILSIANVDMVGALILYALMNGVSLDNKYEDENGKIIKETIVLVEKKNLKEIKKLTNRVLGYTIEVIEYVYKESRIKTFFNDEKINLFFDGNRKQKIPFVLKLRIDEEEKEYRYVFMDSKEKSEESSSFVEIENNSWNNLYNSLKGYIMKRNNFYKHIRLRNYNDITFYDKTFDVQITPELVNIISGSDSYMDDMENALKTLSDNELEILYPQNSFDRNEIIKQLPYYVLIRLWSSENMDLVCLGYINKLLRDDYGLEDIKNITNRTLTKRVEITESYSNAENKMALLFEQPTDNSDSDYYNLDEYYRNGEQIMPIVFEIRHTTDTKGNDVYRYEIVQ